MAQLSFTALVCEGRYCQFYPDFPHFPQLFAGSQQLGSQDQLVNKSVPIICKICQQIEGCRFCSRHGSVNGEIAHFTPVLLII